jgi:16S rRNA (guanine1207-N2)-methyltransferase
LIRDSACTSLFAELQNILEPTFWFADENVVELVELVAAHPQLTLITNRFDVWQAATRRQIRAIFSDFDVKDYPKEVPVEKILYRISKEKPLVHHLLNQAADLLDQVDGELFICGLKQQGIKTYADNLIKVFHANGKLKKTGQHYIGRFSQLSVSAKLDCQQYPEPRLIKLTNKDAQFLSKPGVYGWNKIDAGTELLLEALSIHWPKWKAKPEKVLDLGCGYGWIFMNLGGYNFTSITATDNNLAAISCAKANASMNAMAVQILASDCANTINDSFDLILCNPPFHQGFAHQKQLIKQFAQSAAEKMSVGGAAMFVANEFVPLEAVAGTFLPKQRVLIKERGFKVVLLEKS